MDGIILIDKPKTWSSFDVVAKVRGIVRSETGLKKPKVGHTGTLDPLATGLMIVVLGSYCKRAQEFSKLDKVYEVTMKLGETSTTDDDEGEKLKIGDRRPESEEVQKAVLGFVGETQQIPPAFSAIKVNGKRAYKLAREGKEVVIEPRTVTIQSITELSYDYPYVRFTTHVSSGTYIRSLVRDIGEKLQTGAYMSDLRRTKVGSFSIENALAMNDLAPETLKNGILQ
jgi:tRNA pseudouridine55 synthase